MRIRIHPLAWLSFGLLLVSAGCADNGPPSPAVAKTTGAARVGKALATGPKSVRFRERSVQDPSDEVPSGAIKVGMICDKEKLPPDMLQVLGFTWNSPDKRWVIDGERIGTYELGQFLAQRVAELKPGGILLEDRDKAGCKEFDEGCAVLIEFCLHHNLNLFKTIPTGNTFMCGAEWIVQARPLSPAAEKLASALRGSWANAICDATKLEPDWLCLYGDRSPAGWVWRMGERRLTPVELVEYLESHQTELRRSGILLRGVGSPPDRDARPAIEALLHFCQRQNIDLVQAIPTRGSFSHDFILPAIWLIGSQPTKPALSQFGTAYSEYLARRSGDAGHGGEPIEFAWGFTDVLQPAEQ
jgi:hypothetical protein